MFLFSTTFSGGRDSLPLFQKWRFLVWMMISSFTTDKPSNQKLVNHLLKPFLAEWTSSGRPSTWHPRHPFQLVVKSPCREATEAPSMHDIFYPKRLAITIARCSMGRAFFTYMLHFPWNVAIFHLSCRYLKVNNPRSIWDRLISVWSLFCWIFTKLHLFSRLSMLRRARSYSWWLSPQ